MILKTIHEYFNSLWHEHSTNNIFSSVSPSYRLKQGVIKTCLTQESLSKHSLSGSLLALRRRRTHRKLPKKLPKLRRFYKLNNVSFGANKLNTIKKYMKIRFRFKNINAIRSIYFPLTPRTNSLFKPSIRLTRRNFVWRRRLKPLKRTKKKYRYISLISRKKIKAMNAISRKKKLRIPSVKKKYYRALHFRRAPAAPSNPHVVNSLYGISANAITAAAPNTNLKSKLNTNSIFRKKHKRYRKYFKSKKLKLVIKKRQLNLLKSKRKIAYKFLSGGVATIPTKFSAGKLSKSQPNIKFINSRLSLRVNNTIGKTLLSYISLFLRFRLCILNLSFKSEKFLMKKMLFSFLKPNESKRSIMNRRKKINVSRFYKRVKNSIIGSNRPTPNFVNNNILSNLAFSTGNNAFNKTSSIKKKSPFELFLPRVKFKPGYQRLWRSSRKAIADNLSARYLYQKQMTKFMLRLSRRLHSYNFAMSESSLDKAILYSRLLPDSKVTSAFLSSGFISLNGWQVSNLKSFVLVGDFIQLTITKWLSIYFRWLIIWTKSNKSKFKNLVFRKGLASGYKLMKQRKQRSRHVPLWVYNSRFDISDVKPNFEVDYFTMSSVMLYEPLLVDYYTPDDMPDHRHYIYRLYNWKYIT